MGTDIFGAFTLLVVVNGQDVVLTCSQCGVIRRDTVDRRMRVDAATEAHVAFHIQSISEGYPDRSPFMSPGT
jgi:hypothetical protein